MPEIITAKNGDHNLDNYMNTYNSFDWKDVEKKFSWYSSGKMNIAYEAIDYHAKTNKHDKIALLYNGFGREEKYTFNDLMVLSNKAGNILKNSAKIKKGDHVFIYMPRTPELYILLLGTIKLGAIVGPLFTGYRNDAIKDRILDSDAKVLITTPELLELVPVNQLPNLNNIILVGSNIEEKDIYIDYNKEIKIANEELEIEWVDREDGFILHYTSGSTGKSKGIYHVHKAMLQYYQTGKWVLDLKENDIYWCTADPGWITGTSYGIFAPWLLGVTCVIAGDRFNPSYWYQIIEKYQVSVWYSSPTAFRMLMGADQDIIKKYNLSSLRHILSVGEPLTPDVVRWSVKTYNIPIHDTWFMTETGAQIICNYPSMDIKPGSMGKPIPGTIAAVIDDDGNELFPLTMGYLAIKKGWPSMMKSIWKNKNEYESSFINDWFITGDSAYMDEDGYFWFQGRVDDVINAAGERIGPFEVESRIAEHPSVEEVGVIGKPDPVKGEIIKAFITLKHGYEPTQELKEEIREFVKRGLSRHAVPQEIDFIDTLPKTRSGKIMRRVLATRELNLPAGDLSALDD